MNRMVGVAALFLCVHAGQAQTSRGTLTGIVSDATAAVIANAAVEARNVDTGITRSTKTNESGVYRFDAVELGTYDLTVKMAGFNEYAARRVPVAGGQTVSIDVRLEVGTTATVTEVTAQAEGLLQTETPLRGGTVSNLQAVHLPVSGRNAVALALTVPGVTTNRYGFGVSTFPVNGSRGRSNNFLIDGTENNDISVAGQAMQIRNPDAVMEVSVQTSNFDAEFGRAGGAVVNTITKSGTNKLHGTLHYLLDVTNDDAITNTQSLNREIAARGKPFPGTEQWYGGTIGGRIIRDRTFYFGSYQEQRQSSTSTNTLTTLTAGGRETLNRVFPRGTNPRVDLYNEITSGATADSRPFPVELGNNRPAIEFGTSISPFGQKFLDRQWLTRIDHKISDRDQISGRYIISHQPSPQGGYVDFFPGLSTSQTNRYQNAAITETHIFSPSLTNELRLPYNRITLDFPADPANPIAKSLPRYAIGGSLTSLGLPTNLPQGRIANNYVVQDTLSYVRGVHSFRMGLDILVQRSRQFAPIRERGEITYTTGGGFTNFANFVDDFGGSAGAAQRDFGSAAYYPEMTRTAFFFQDRWRATSSLTLTLGVRWEDFGTPMNTLKKPAFSGLFNVDPNSFTGPFLEPNKVGRDLNNFSPTVGVAWTPSGRLFGQKATVIRTGYQIGYDSFFNNIASNAAVATPNVIATLVNSRVSATEPRGFANISRLLPSVATAPAAIDSQTLMLQNLRNPYYQRWSFGVQRTLPGELVVDVSYVGSKGTRLFINEDLNPVVPASLRILPNPNIPAARQTLRLDALQGSRLIRTNGGGSNYNSLQADVQRRFSGGLFVKAAYTWSKNIDNSSEVFGVAATNSPQQSAVPSIFGGLKPERAVSLFDRRHRAVFSYVYQLPMFKAQKGVTGRVLGGWEVAGVTTFESGVPLTILNGQDADGLGGNLDRPLYNPNGTPGVRAVPLPNGTYLNPDAGNAVINPSTAMYIGILANTGAAVAPTGNLGRNTHLTPGINNFDVNFEKSVVVTEGMRVSFRAEFYNFFNNPQYGSPSISPFSPGQQGVSANVFTSPAGRFLQPQFADGGGRVVRYQLRLQW